MIEIEKKFILNEVAKDRLLEGAEFLSEKTIHDEYFDTEDFSLTKKDWWLRSRNGQFEFKIANHEGIDRLVDSYKEIEDETEVKKMLNFPIEKDLKASLSEHGYTVFCAFTTIRKKYQKEGFGLDLDIATAPNFSFEVAEIELMVDNQSEAKDAIDKILDFADRIGLEKKRVQGKVAVFLKLLKPDHFKALIEAGVLMEE